MMKSTFTFIVSLHIFAFVSSFDFNEAFEDVTQEEPSIVPDENSKSTNDLPKTNSKHAFTDEKDLFSKGKAVYEAMLQDSQSYGDCWLQAINKLHSDCKKLTDEIQARLALMFTNCFLEKTGKVPYPCDDASPVKTCTEKMDNTAFVVFSQHFTHTQSVCFFLSNQLWQKKTNAVVNRLSSAASEASKKIESLHTLQESSLEHQQTLNEEMLHWKQALEESTQTISQLRSIEYSILDRFIEMKQFVVVETSKFYSIFYYIATFFVCYFITATQTTGAARSGLTAFVVLNVFIEFYFIPEYFLKAEDSMYEDINHLASRLNSWIWRCRKVFWFLEALYLIYIWLTYKDINRLNNELLLQIKKENEEMKGLLSGLVLNVRSLPPIADDSSSDESFEPSFGSEDADDSADAPISEAEVSSTTLDSGTVCCSPLYEKPTPQKRYNFRQRDSVKGFVSDLKESVSEFALVVHSSALLSKGKNPSKILSKRRKS